MVSTRTCAREVTKVTTPDLACVDFDRTEEHSVICVRFRLRQVLARNADPANLDKSTLLGEVQNWFA